MYLLSVEHGQREKSNATFKNSFENTVVLYRYLQQSSFSRHAEQLFLVFVHFLGTLILLGHYSGPRFASSCNACRRRWKLSTKSKVKELNRPIALEPNVVWLQVSKYKSSFVKIRQGAGDLNCQFQLVEYHVVSILICGSLNLPTMDALD